MAPSAKHAAALAAAADASVDPMADASLKHLEDEITTGPAANWEVAYVFSFLERFTQLVDYDATNPVLPNVMALEQALLDASPPASAFAAVAAATAGVSNPTRSSARLEENKRSTAPLTAVPFRAAAAAAAAATATTNGNGAAPDAEVATEANNGGAVDEKPQPQQPPQTRSGSPASSLSSLTASESGADAGATAAAVTPQDEAAYLAAIEAVETASVEPIDPVPLVLPAAVAAEMTDSPPGSELLKDIVEIFIENLRPIKELSEYHGKKTWFHFLINFVTYRFNSDPYYRGGFRWETNLLRTRGLKPGQEKEAKWWNLRWEDKIHLLRQMVDFQLTNAPAVRDLIKEQYDIGHQRNSCRDPNENFLVLSPAGRTSTHVTLFHLDSSPRLYACGNLYKDDSPWIAVSSTLKGYKAFLKTLAEPTRAEKKSLELSEAEAAELLEEEAEQQAAASSSSKGPVAKAAVAGGKGRKSKGKAAATAGEDRFKEERMTRARLEADLKDMAVYEKHLAALEARRMRASERAARNLSRGYNAPVPATTRSSRLRAREANLRGGPAVDYNENGTGDDADEDDDDDEGADGPGRRKRRRLDGDDSVRSSAAPSDAGSVTAAGTTPNSASAATSTGRRASGRQLPPAVPGERRSSRLQPQPEPESELEHEPEAKTEKMVVEPVAVDDSEPNAPSPREPRAKTEPAVNGNGTTEMSKSREGLADDDCLKREGGSTSQQEEEQVEVKAGPLVAAPAAEAEGSTIPATPEEPSAAAAEEEVKPIEEDVQLVPAAAAASSSTDAA
ncbi:hypothetical protein JCM3774_000554 [Rhodotorula dairenensis]